MDFCKIEAVILYDEIASGFRAKGVCDRVAMALAEDVKLRVSLWRSDMVEDANESALALSEAVGADLIVVAFRRAGFLTRKVREWLEGWAAGKHVGHAALVVISDEVGPSLVARQLREFARAHGLKCFCDDLGRAGGTGGSAGVNNGESPLGMGIPPILERIGQYTHWGLNE